MKRGVKNPVYYRELVDVFRLVARDRDLLEEFLEDIFTPREQADIAVRWQIVKQLDRGTTQRDVVKNLRVSMSKITRGSRELLNKDGGFARALSYVYPHRRNRKN